MRSIERSAGHRAGYKQLVRELGLGGGRERRLLLEQLARITARGELVKTGRMSSGALPRADPEKTARAAKSGMTAWGGDRRGGPGVSGDAGPAGGGAAGSASRWVWVCAAEWELGPERRSVYSAERVERRDAGRRGAGGRGSAGTGWAAVGAGGAGADAAEPDGGGDLSLCAAATRRSAWDERSRGRRELCDAAG